MTRKKNSLPKNKRIMVTGFMGIVGVLAVIIMINEAGII